MKRFLRGEWFSVSIATFSIYLNPASRGMVEQAEEAAADLTHLPSQRKGVRDDEY